MEPLLSIVIANYNYGRFLESAILSVVSQGMGELVELIICDAASSDNSVEIIKKYENCISWWCSEPDGGQSAAFNKGFSHAHGKFLTWLNADDVLMPGALKKFQCAVASFPDCKWFVGGVMWLDKDLRIIKCGRGRPFSRVRANMGVVSVWGPSSIFHRELLARVGGVAEELNYTMDTDLWMKFYYIGMATYMPFADYAWGLRIHEEAKTSSHFFADGDDSKEKRKLDEMHEEMREILRRYKPPARQSLLRLLLSVNLYGSCMGRLDTLRLKGKYYEDCFKKEFA